MAIFVGRDSAMAQQWIDTKAKALELYKPKANPKFIEETGADIAMGDGVGLVLFRDANIAVMCRHRSDADGWAKKLHTAISDVPWPWPDPPTLTGSGNGWMPTPDDTQIHLAFVGGTPDSTVELRFLTPPDRLIAWDGWGRSAVADLTEE